MRSRLRLGGSLVAALLLTATTVAAQTPAPDARKTAVIRRILEETRAADQILAAIETGIPAQRAASPAIPPVFWERFIEAARAQRGVLLDTLVPIYARTFELSELEGLLAFHMTPLGRRLIEIQPAILRDSAQAGQAWGAQIGAAIGEQLAKEGVQLRP
jgi:hypothetical protein